MVYIYLFYTINSINLVNEKFLYERNLIHSILIECSHLCQTLWGLTHITIFLPTTTFFFLHICKQCVFKRSSKIFSTTNLQSLMAPRPLCLSSSFLGLSHVFFSHISSVPPIQMAIVNFYSLDYACLHVCDALSYLITGEFLFIT